MGCKHKRVLSLDDEKSNSGLSALSKSHQLGDAKSAEIATVVDSASVPGLKRKGKARLRDTPTLPDEVNGATSKTSKDGNTGKRKKGKAPKCPIGDNKKELQTHVDTNAGVSERIDLLTCRDEGGDKDGAPSTAVPVEPDVTKNGSKMKLTAKKIAKQMSRELSSVLEQLQQVRTSADLENVHAQLSRVQVTSEQQQAVLHSRAGDIAAVDGSPVTVSSAQAIEAPAAKEQQSVASDRTKKAAPAVDDTAEQPAKRRKKDDSSSFQRAFDLCTAVGAKEARKRREALRINIEETPLGDKTPAPVLKFSELGVFPQWLDRALVDNGWTAPTAIQSQALPLLLSGKSLIGIAQTGSGKTGAFLLPAIVHIAAQAPLSRKERGPIMLALAPTRELAVQISDEADKLIKHSPGMRSVCFYGGGNKQDQLWRFSDEGAHIVVATPGRLADFLENKKLSLKRVTYLVFDEADRMLDDGFSGEVNQVVSLVRPDRQVALFSATWPASVQSLSNTLFGTGASGENPVRIRVGANKAADNDGPPTAREGITQQVVVVDLPENEWKKAEVEKRRIMDAHIREVLTASKESKLLVFVNTKALADDLSCKLYAEGFSVDSMHGGRAQETRLNVLQRFREGSIRMLVVTDVFSRGLDIPDVSHVVIFDMGDIHDYVHRIGRTCRGVSGSGHALVFFEYWPGDPGCAAELIRVLKTSKQEVPEGLLKIAADVEAGKRPVRTGKTW